MKNFFFDNFENSGEQSLIEDLIVESIRIYGHDMHYIPRNADVTRENYDTVFNDVTKTVFDQNYMIEMYIRNIDSFEGEGSFMSKFGLQIRDQITFSVAMKTFESEVTQQSWHNHAYDDQETVFSATLEKPREGDLLYFPLNKKLFEIKFVEHESIFYQMGALQLYDIKCELFEYSGEIFNTGIVEVDEYYGEMYENRFTTNEQTLEGSDFFSDNNTFQKEAEEIIDWSERDPFSELNGDTGKW